MSEALQIIRDPNPGGPAKTYESSGSGTLIERHGVKTPTLLCYLPYFSSVNEDDVCPPSYTVFTFSHTTSPSLKKMLTKSSLNVFETKLYKERQSISYFQKKE